MRSPWALALTGVVALSSTVAAQERREAPQQIEQAVRRRVDSWLRERAPAKLTCPTCKGEQYRQPPCESCNGTRVNPHRVDNAFWRYLRPSYRRGKDRDDWIQERIFGGRDMGTAHWGNHPAVIEGARVETIQVSRDAVYVTISPGESSRGWGVRPQIDTWVREERAFYIDLSNDPAEDLLQHEWFVLGTFSINRFADEIDRLTAEEARPNLTDLERAQLRRDREKVEQDLQKRTIADLGVVTNVRKLTGMRRDEPTTFEVSVTVGLLTLSLRIPATDEVPADKLEEQLSALSQGTRVYFRGQPAQWRRSHEYLGLAELSLTGCEVQTSP